MIISAFTLDVCQELHLTIGVELGEDELPVCRRELSFGFNEVGVARGLCLMDIYRTKWLKRTK